MKKRYFPSPFLVIIAMMIIFIIASWIGEATLNDVNGIGILDVFTAVWHGFSGKVDVILFILSIGGTLGVMTKIKAIDAGLNALVKKLGNKIWLLIPSLMIIFGLGGTTYGMWEETIAFIPILIPVFKKANYGPFTAIMVIILGAGTGCLASTINPFSVGSAVDAINPEEGAPIISTGSQQGLRWLSFFIFECVAITIVSWMATRYKKAILANYKTDAEAIKASGSQNKILSFFTRARVVEGIDHKGIDERFKDSGAVEFTKKRKASLILFVFAFLLMIIMYLPWGNWIDLGTSTKEYDKSMFWFASTSSAGYAKIGDWYFTSVAALFLLVAVVIFAINIKSLKSEDKNSEQVFISSYMDGAKDVLTVCLLIATAGGLGEILTATNFGPLIAENAAKGLNSWVWFGLVVFLVSIVLSFLVPSTSGFAGAFMPIFAQIGMQAFPSAAPTAIGIAMLGFLFANGLANFVTPTSAALMGYTAYAGVPYNVWIKQTWKFTLSLFFLSLVIILSVSLAASSGSKLF